jgi:hypothetical protein
VLVRGYVEEVVIACGAEVIARHERSYAREDFVFDPLHYLALLEQKIGALDQAAPLQGWTCPRRFATLRRLLEARMGKPASGSTSRCCACSRPSGSRTCTPRCARRSARGDRLRCRQAPGLCRIERRPPKLDLVAYPYLPRVTVAATQAKAYMALLSGAAA